MSAARAGLHQPPCATSLRGVLLIKNLALMLLVGLPTRVATGIITLMREGGNFSLRPVLPSGAG